MFGEIVRSHRVRLGMTQEELADCAKLSVRGIGKIERGKIGAPRPHTVRLLADAFGLTGDAREQFCNSAAAMVAVDPSPDQANEARSFGGYARPAQLPAGFRTFTGREAELTQLDELLAGIRLSTSADGSGSTPTSADSVVIVVVSGTAGIGKTALAVHWAQRVRHRFPDGQLYVDLRGFDPSGSPVPPAEAVRRFLDAFGIPPQQIPHGFEAQVGLYRSLMAGKRVLVVLDNARDAEQMRPLLPGTPGCLAIVTSRNHLSGLIAESAHPLPLDLLSADEARELLARRLGPHRIEADPQTVSEIITLCARLPLALAVVAARAAHHPTFSLAALASELRETSDSLDIFASSDTATDARAVFSWSYRQLSPAAAMLFRLLGMHPGPDIAIPAAASLAGVSPRQARRLLAESSDAHLVTEHTAGRYTFHDLLRIYAVEQAHSTDPDDQRTAAIHRLQDHYVHTAHTAARLLQPARDQLALTTPRPGVTVETPADSEHALAWFTAEHAVLLAVLDQAQNNGSDRCTWQLACSLRDFLGWRGYWHDAGGTLKAALKAAQRLADPSKQAYVHRLIAEPHLHLNRTADADTHLNHALRLYEQCGDHVGQAFTHTSLGCVRERQSRFRDAIEHVEHARDLFQAAGHKLGQAKSLNNLGYVHALLGNPQQALVFCQQALIQFQELGSRPGQASTWDSLGYAHQHLGHHTEAITCYHHALNLARSIGNQWLEATVLIHLGDFNAATGDFDSANAVWQQSLALLDQLNHPDTEPIRAKLRQLNRTTAAKHNTPANLHRRS